MTATIEATRFNKVDVPTALPGACGLCQSDKGPFVDTGIWKPMMGRLYICERCTKEIYSLFDIKKEEPEPIPGLTRQEFEEVTNELSNGLADRLSDLLDYLRSSSVAVIQSEVIEDVSDSGSDIKRADESDKQDDSGNSEQGPVSVPSNSSNGDESLFDL